MAPVIDKYAKTNGYSLAARFVESLAAGSAALGDGVGGLDQDHRGRLQRAVGCCSSGRKPAGGRSDQAGRHDSGRDQAGCVCHQAAVVSIVLWQRPLRHGAAFPCCMGRLLRYVRTALSPDTQSGVNCPGTATIADRQRQRVGQNSAELWKTLWKTVPAIPRGHVLSATYQLCPASDAHSTSRKIRRLADM